MENIIACSRTFVIFRQELPSATCIRSGHLICACHYDMALVNKNLAHRGADDKDGGDATITPQAWDGNAIQICQVADIAGNVQYFSCQ